MTIEQVAEVAVTERILSLIDAHAYRRAEVEKRVAELVAGEFAQAHSLYDPRELERVTGRVATVVAAGQVGVARATDTYMSRVTTLLTGTAVAGVGVAPYMSRTLRRGVADHAEVYNRVPATYRRAVAAGSDEAVALRKALVRAQAMASTDLGLAFQMQAGEFMETRTKIARYRRIVRPELSLNGACGLCVVASHRPYYVADLMPLHARCKCTVLPIVSGRDPGPQINDAAVGYAYRTAANVDPEKSTSGRALKEIRVTVEQHGELGPILRYDGHHFLGPSIELAS